MLQVKASSADVVCDANTEVEPSNILRVLPGPS